MRAPTAVSDACRRSLETALARSVAGEVRFDRLTRAIYSTDASLYEIAPAGVVLPRDADDVLAVVELCRSHGVPIVARGGGTGIAGGALGWGVTLDFSKFMHSVVSIDPDARTAAVQPGITLDELNAAVAARSLHFPPDVATASRATIGGMIANNSCGAHSVYYGRTVDYVESLTCVLATGELVRWRQAPFRDLPPIDQPEPHRDAAIPLGADAPTARIGEVLRRARADVHDEVLARYPRVMRRNGGYALDRLCMSDELNPATLVCGSEGTLALVVEATLRLVPPPKCRALVVLHFGSVLDAVAATPAVLRHKPAAVELVDEMILRAGAPQVAEDVRRQFLVGIPAAVLIGELYDDDEASLHKRMDALVEDLRSSAVGQRGLVVYDNAVQQAVWTLRNKGFGLLMSRPGRRHPLEFIEDAAVEPAKLRDYISDLQAMLSEEGVGEVGYYAHASVGVIHVRPTLDLHDRRDVTKLRRIADRTTRLVLKYGGSMTGEHGDGIVRSEWLARMYGPRIVRAFAEIKRAFDPHNLFNPRKIVDPLRMDQRLRGEASVRHLPQATHFDYGAHGDMAGLAGMCSGVGQCRQKLVGVMCPSYVATLDERHTTRGRALALRAALSDRGLLRGLDDAALDEAMDLCLSCKACKSECPTGVDMARLKAEWLARRNQTRGATRAARFLADAPHFARLGSRWPALANWIASSPTVRALLERRYGVDARVPPPAFAPQTFRSWFARHAPAGQPARGRVVYFVDTWMDAYWPSVGVAAVKLLEAAGYEVLAPELRCCGRPLISKGFLDEARTLGVENVDRLAPLIDERTWIVGSEPSCVLTFMDELPHFVRSADAKRIASRVRLVDALLADSLPPVAAPAIPPRRVLLHGHCHQRALVGAADTLAMLRRAGLDASEINSGCCGMAGSFGHEREHYDVSRAIGEQRLFPAVRQRGNAEIAVCGFSCREQLAHHVGVAPRHALEIAADALSGTERVAAPRHV